MNRLLALSFALAFAVDSPAGRAQGLVPGAGSEPILRWEFIFEQAPFSECHASTIVESRDGLVAAWFGGTAEGHPDVGIWLSRFEEAHWTVPVKVANGVETAGVAGAGRPVPCWNPVLYQVAGGPLLLFYKAGPSPGTWRGMMKESSDGGRSWSAPRLLPAGILGPVKNKPVALPDGSLLCPSSSEDAGWRVHMEQTPDLGRTWSKSGPLNDGREFAAIQPAILTHPGGRLQILCRSKQGCLTECRSADGLIHVTYTWKRVRIKHVVLDPARFPGELRPDALTREPVSDAPPDEGG